MTYRLVQHITVEELINIQWVKIEHRVHHSQALVHWLPGRIAQSAGHLTRKSGVLGSIPSLATYFLSPSAFSRRTVTVVSYWRKYVQEVLVNRLGGLNLPRKNWPSRHDLRSLPLTYNNNATTTTTNAWFINCTGWQTILCSISLAKLTLHITGYLVLKIWVPGKCPTTKNIFYEEVKSKLACCFSCKAHFWTIKM